MIISVFLGGLYGALYDQITYSISEEFFTKMRFEKYDISPSLHPRVGAAIVGFRNTWLTGLTLGIVLASIGFLHDEHRKMFKYTIQGYGITLSVAFIFSLIAFLFVSPLTGESMMNGSNYEYNKIIMMNNYSYAGAIVGMFGGVAWQIYKTKASRTNRK